MELNYFHVDAFAETLFAGNPAGVVPLEMWLDEHLMQQIAAENNHAETAFFIPEASGYRIRWFSPKKEINLCGHATLASAHVLFEHLGFEGDIIRFFYREGILNVSKSAEGYRLDFPLEPPMPVTIDPALFPGIKILENVAANDHILLLEDETAVRDFRPDLTALSKLDRRGVMVTAKGNEYDFVFRFFAPNAGIDEDPATGSALTQLYPYWQYKNGKKTMSARQLSARGACFMLEAAGKRLLINGQARTYLKGTLYV